MTSERIHELFQQTLTGEYDDDLPWNAVEELRKNGSREIFEIASQRLQDYESTKRARSAAILSQLREFADPPLDKPKWLFRPEAFALITTMLEREDNSVVLSSSLAALGFLDNPAAVSILTSYAKHPDDDVRFSITCALGNFSNDADAVKQLLALSKDAEPNIRDWAVFGFGVQGDLDSAQIRDALFERLSDSDEDAREEALVGLGKRRDLRVLPVLRSLLDAPTLKLRVAESASAMLGLPADPEEWQADDYKRALEETFGPPPT